jgi:nucleoside-diphosphate-sugar epimerase
MTSFQGKKVLVTGGAGFIGSHLVRRLVAEGALVHLIVKPSTALERIEDVRNSVTIHQSSLEDVSSVENILGTIAPDGIFHLAGESQSFGRIPSAADLIKTNVSASIGLMDAASKLPIEFFVNTGTFAEYGSKESAIREDMVFEPKELYGISRIPADLYAQALGREQGKPFVTIRTFTPYGPYLQKGKLIHEVIAKALAGTPLTLSRPSVTRDFIYIDDLIELYCRAALKAGECRGESFNGGSGTATTLEELSSAVLKYTGPGSAISWSGQDVSYDRARWQSDMSKAARRLSFSPAHTLGQGLEKTVEWFRAHPEHWSAGSR